MHTRLPRPRLGADRSILAVLYPDTVILVPFSGHGSVHGVAILSEGYYHEREIYQRHAQDGTDADSKSKSSIVREPSVDRVFCCAGAPRISHYAGYEEDD
jgi:hypothetical protein